MIEPGPILLALEAAGRRIGELLTRVDQLEVALAQAQQRVQELEREKG